MPAIVTEKLHVHNAQQFVESLTESANDVYYMFIGRPTTWPAGDATIPTPTDTVANTHFDYWRDIIAFRRITANDVCHVVPLHEWANNTQYAMYDHRTPQSTVAASSFYVMTPAPDRAVFKCLHDGRTNATSGAALSTSEPLVGGDVTALVSSAGSLNSYTWKYLYSISEADALKFLTPTYMPVRNVSEGDVSDAFTIFDAARTSGNGAIHSVVVETAGSAYTGDVTVEIVGDGSGAVAQPVLSGQQVIGINVVSGGEGYTWATVSVLTTNTGSGATATAIISPNQSFTNTTGTFYVTNHGINLVDELYAKRVMVSVEFDGAGDNSELAIGNDYRRIGIIRNPVLYGTGTRATANTYRQTLVLTVEPRSGAEFTPDELVYQPETNAFGVLVRIDGNDLTLTHVQGTFAVSKNIQGIGNGDAAGHGVGVTKNIPATPSVFPSPVPASGASTAVNAVDYPDLQPFSGDILYVDQRAPITRANNQTEVIRTILTF